MGDCCKYSEDFGFTTQRLIQLAPCPPPWHVELLDYEGRRHNVSRNILDDIHTRCRRQRELHAVPVLGKPICVEGCRTGATAAVVVVVMILVIGVLVWKIKSRCRKRRLPRVKKINPVLDLKNKIELSIITMDGDSVISSDSGGSTEGYYTTIVDRR